MNFTLLSRLNWSER